jgi:hypothetical protein
MARHLAPMLAICCALTGIQAAEVPPTLPDQIATGWVTALRNNDLTAAYGLLRSADQERAEREWQRAVGLPDPFVDLQINVLLNMARQANGAEQIAAMAQPLLAQINPQTLSNQVTEVAGFLGLAAKNQPPNTTPSVDYAGLHTWLKDIAAFIPKAGLTDQAKVKAATEHLTAAIKATSIRDASDARGLKVAEFIKQISPALPELKKALEVYDIKLDQMLDSFGFTLIDATPTSCTIIVSFTTLDKPRSFGLKLVAKNDSWSLTDGADNPIAALSQLVMMSLLMHSMGTGAPAQPPPVPINDGAL